MAEADEIRALRRALEDAKDQLEATNVSRANGNVTNFTINASGIGVIVTVCAAAVMLTCNLFLVGVLVYKLSDYDRQISDNAAYAQAAYRGAGYQRGIDDGKASDSRSSTPAASTASGSAESPDP